MNDDLAEVFARPSGTFRPRVHIRSRAGGVPAGDDKDGGPHVAIPPRSEFRPSGATLVENQADTMDTTDRDALSTDGQRGKNEYQLESVGLAKSYRKAAVEIPVLKEVNLAVSHGEFLAIVGQSGSGKSTLLHLLGTLDAPDAGSLFFEGQRIDNLPIAQRDRLRNHCFGMIFQFYHLLPELTTLENVLAPLMIGKSVLGFLSRRRAYRKAAERLLELVCLSHRLKHRPRELSGGEMQRAAIARALIAGPDLLLADEPTGNLDRGTGQDILELLCSLNRQENLTIVMVTHDLAIAERADRVVRLVDGRIEKA